MTYESPPLKAWSFSRLEVFEKCPKRAELQFVKKITEENDPKREEALTRGKKVHEAAEQYVRGEIDNLPKELKKFEGKFEEMRKLYATEPEKLVLEENWAFTIDWQPTEWYGEDAWCRMVLDRFEWLSDDKTAGELTDYKTGKKEGNEVKHGQQGQLFVLGAFMKYPSLQAVRVKFEYLDHGKTSLPKTYSREQAMTFLSAFERRGKAMTEATVFPPRPNRINCAWCPYGPSRGNGMCEYGVEA
jgi:hypothetical protein